MTESKNVIQSVQEENDAGSLNVSDIVSVSPKESKGILRPQLGTISPKDITGFQEYMRTGNDTHLQTKALNSTVDSEGGHLVPTEMSDLITTHLRKLSPLRQIASVTEISTEAIDMLIDVREADAGWVSETGARTETITPQFRKKRIYVHEMYASPRATQKLLDDAHIDVESWLVQRVGQKMAAMESTAFLHGDGTTCPRGLMRYPLRENPDVEEEVFQHLITGAPGDFAEDNGADILIEAVNQLDTQDLQGACWLMSRSAYARIRKLKDENGNYLWMPGLNGGHPGLLFGYPVFLCDAMPALVVGNMSQSIIFGNFKRAYQIIDRNKERLHVLRDAYTHKPFIEFYVTSRVGGDVVNFNALKFITFGEEKEIPQQKQEETLEKKPEDKATDE